MKNKPANTVPVSEQKILVVKKGLSTKPWNNHLSHPLSDGEKVVVSPNQTRVEKGYVRVRHGRGGVKVESVFSIFHFTTITGKELSE